jgi:hypothetical protein
MTRSWIPAGLVSAFETMCAESLSLEKKLQP